MYHYYTLRFQADIKKRGDKHCVVALRREKGVASLKDLVFSELQASY
jgi:hypothetical protein